MRTLSVLTALMLVMLISARAVAQDESIGEGEDENSACFISPAACLGAGTPLPVAGSAGSTSPPQPGCISGRIVTPEAGGQSDGFPYCPDTDGDGIADTPAVPTHAEVVAAICPSPPPAVVGHNPREYGITGLHTWLWSAGDTTSRSASGTIRTYPVTCTLTATSFHFDTGDPHAQRYGHPRSYTSDQPGGEHEDTPVQHFWEVKGTFTLTHTVTWSRTSDVGADTTTTTTATDYPVKEVVGGMTTADG
ncbi:MAG TPA: hypothetical protein VMM13_12420 [Euzebya sp.]|nr:hypothetical protein [Euzebya sp.]